MVKRELTAVEGKYLTLIYRRYYEESRVVGTTDLARSFKVQPATVTETVQKLAEKGFLEYSPYREIRLTEKGVYEAQRLLRNHRLLEVLFVNALNYEASKACEEAAKLEHYVSETLVNKVCQVFKHPLICPCQKTTFHAGRCGEKQHV
ncbi:MAG: metal-dependent transcriptional regulator [Candidatus Bathyarchaeia archaeon]